MQDKTIKEAEYILENELKMKTTIEKLIAENSITNINDFTNICVASGTISKEDYIIYITADNIVINVTSNGEKNENTISNAILSATNKNKYKYFYFQFRINDNNRIEFFPQNAHIFDTDIKLDMTLPIYKKAALNFYSKNLCEFPNFIGDLNVNGKTKLIVEKLKEIFPKLITTKQPSTACKENVPSSEGCSNTGQFGGGGTPLKDIKLFLYANNVTKGTIKLSKPQVEVGTFATDWRPNPSDYVERNSPAYKEIKGLAIQHNQDQNKKYIEVQATDGTVYGVDLWGGDAKKLLEQQQAEIEELKKMVQTLETKINV